jgi:hypothetical protein
MKFSIPGSRKIKLMYVSNVHIQDTSYYIAYEVAGPLAHQWHELSKGDIKESWRVVNN